MIVKINGTELSDFTVNDITFNYDAVSDTFSLSTPFFEDWERSEKNKVSRGFFKPLKYYPVEILDNNRKLLLTGTLLNHNFKSNANANEISLSGYSKTGILDDCPNVIFSEDQAVNAETTEEKDTNESRSASSNYSGLSLLELAKQLVEPFKIEVIVDDLVKDRCNEDYDSTTTKETESIAGYLAKLATLKNVVMRSTPDGKLKFTQIDPNLKSVAKFSIGDGVVNEISLQVNGQAMHSEIHGLSKVNIYADQTEDAEKTGDSEVIKNPLITSITRPTIKTQGVESGMIKDFLKAALADELKNISITIDCKGWQMVEDGILIPGMLISVLAPGVYLYNYTTLLVRSIQLKENAKEKTSSLTCILPETMTGEQPKLIFD
jgi:prophage tail gpP-like protein